MGSAQAFQYIDFIELSLSSIMDKCEERHFSAELIALATDRFFDRRLKAVHAGFDLVFQKNDRLKQGK
jgi:hypothetical protein